jgi:anti-sigma B factor antagonist
MIDFHYATVGKNDDIVSVVVSGRLDEENCHYLFDCIEQLIEEGRSKVILDCARLEYVSSMGLGMLVRVHARMSKHGGDVKLAALQSTIVSMFSLVGLNRLFHIYPTVEDAITALGG